MEPESRPENLSAAGRLKAYLDDSNLELNSRLPPERTLSRQLGVSRSLLRKALAEMEAEGQIWRHVGRGTFIGSRPLESANGIDYISSHTTPRELMRITASRARSIFSSWPSGRLSWSVTSP